MQNGDYLVERYNGLSQEKKNKVIAYFPAIAGSQLASMMPLHGMKLPFDRVCTGTDIELYAQCLADAIVFAESGRGDCVTVSMGDSKTLAKMLGMDPIPDSFNTVVSNLGYEGFEISSESYDGDDFDFDDAEEVSSSRYKCRRSKQVPDRDGFMDDYTWYEDTFMSRHVFVFGDNEVYGPEDGNFDHECDTEREAEEWFESYKGFVEEDEPEEPIGTGSTGETGGASEKKVEPPKEADDSADAEPESVGDLDKMITACFGGTIPNYVAKILNTYDLLYSSGYDLRRPYGVLGNDGIYYVDNHNHSELRVGAMDMDFSTSIKMYTLFQSKLGFLEKPCRSSGVIGMEIVNQYISNPSTIMYFPQKCLEIMFGRVPATAKKEANGEKIVYFAKSQNINSWAKYRDQDVKQHLSKLLLQCVRVYVERTGMKDKLRTLEAVNAVNGLLNYAITCLSIAVLVIDYKSSKGLPAKFKVRVADPAGRLNAGYDYTTEIIREVFSGNMGGLESKRLSSGLNKQLSTEYRVYEYAHEFDHKVSNAAPLFAYKALEALQARGETVNWHSAIIGQALDDTILRNGSGGINLSSALFHHINAGSRSGKGVMTLNMLASGIASGKALFYLDNKVDMGSMLSSLAHSGGNAGSVNGPDMFVVNGSNFEKDDFGEFQHRNNWIIQEHIPQEVRVLFGSSSWETLGELFYLRAYMLCLGIVFARGSDSNAKGNDPMFGGENGIMVIVDEINQVQTRMLEKATIMADVVPPLDTEYQNRIDAIKAAASNEKEMAKLPKLLRSFKRQFNGASYYALSLLKSYGDCIQSIKNKSFSGFKDSEARASDIFVIGQNLEPVPVGDLNAVLKTCRYKGDTDIGLNKMANGGNKVRTQSIPYQMTLFKSADAFIGYNGPQPAYLMQTMESSRAYGVLDKTARGFAYIPSFATPVEGEKPATQFCSLSKANDSSTVYFKPYLILNRGDMESSYVQEMFGYAEEAGASREAIIAEYPDENDPTRISQNVGFIEYMTMMGLDNLPARLRTGADIANHVVANYLGYQGMPGSTLPLWLQFVTDLRIEWMFSPQDIWALCTGNSEYNIGKGVKSKVTGEYCQYVKDLADLQLMGVDVADPTVTPSAIGGGDGSYSAEDVEAFERRAGFSSTEDGSNPVDEATAERERMAHAMGDTSDIGDEGAFIDFDDDDESEDSDDGLGEMRSGMGAFDFKATNAAGSAHKEGSAGYSTVSEAISPVNMDAIEAALAVLRNSGYKVTLDMGSYSVGADGKMVSDFEPAQGQTDMGDVFTDVGEVDSDEAFEKLVNGVTTRVIRDYGGLGRIRSFAIVGDSIVINKVMYRCKIDEHLANQLYVDLRREVNAGNICRLFNYKMLAGMTELVELKCDSVSFMYDYVNYGAFGDCDVPIRAYFDAFPKLRLLQIGKDKYTREAVYAEDVESPYYIQSKGSKFFDTVHANTKKWNQGAWSWGKSKLTDKKSKWYQKILWAPIVAGAVGVTAATRGVSAGVSAIKTASDKEKQRQAHEEKVGGFVDNLRKGFRSAKESIQDLFSEE